MPYTLVQHVFIEQLLDVSIGAMVKRRQRHVAIWGGRQSSRKLLPTPS
ncbi:MAG: hypothetical protein IPN76_11815 [Saprospiraceae bacterium]|nr:hypothetical protein [Saprospiraceae bacterium]